MASSMVSIILIDTTTNARGRFELTFGGSDLCAWLAMNSFIGVIESKRIGLTHFHRSIGEV